MYVISSDTPFAYKHLIPDWHQNCRFHFIYSSVENPDYPNTLLEIDYVCEVDFEGLPNVKDTIPTQRAYDLFYDYGDRLYCEDCHPLIAPETNDFQVCGCKPYEHFVSNRWLCLPCFFVEESKAYSRFDCVVEYVGHKAGGRPGSEYDHVSGVS